MPCPMRRHLFAIALLLLVTFGVFSRVLQADFVAWDDELSVTGNTFIRGLDAHRLGWMFTNVSYVMRYKPLGWLSYALIYAGAAFSCSSIPPSDCQNSRCTICTAPVTAETSRVADEK